jgi:hypothetical protein
MKSVEVILKDGRKRVDVELDESDDHDSMLTGQEMLSIWNEHFPGECLERMQINFKTFDNTPCSCGGCHGEKYEIIATFSLREESSTKD